jgi:hypothetical protein
MNNLLPVTPSIDQLARIIGNVAAPAFLLGAVASFISVLISRINRVVDRAQFLHGIAESDTSRTYLKAGIPRLSAGRPFSIDRCSALSSRRYSLRLSSSSPSLARTSKLLTNMARRYCLQVRWSCFALR